MKQRRITLLLALIMLFFCIGIRDIKAEAGTTSNFSYSGSGLDSYYYEGDTFYIDCSIKSRNGEAITKVHFNAYRTSNNNDNYNWDEYPYSTSFDCDEFGKFKVGRDIFEYTGGTYQWYIYAKTESMANGDLIMSGKTTIYEEEEEEDAPYVSGAKSSYSVYEGDSFTLSGTVYGESRLTAVTAMIRNDYNIDTQIKRSPSSSSYSLSNFTFDLSDYDLPAGGSYSVWIFAKTENYTDASSPICKIPLTINKKSENPPYVSGMSSSYTINKGEKLRINGTVYGYSQLTTVTVSVTDWSREADRQSCSPYSKSYSLSNFTLDTSSLAAGTYTVRVWAHTANCQPGEDIAEAILYVNEIHEDAPYVSGASSSYTVSEDGRITLSGTVYGESRLTVVTAMIRNDYNIDTKISYTPNSSSYSLSNFTFNLSDYDLPAGGSYSVWIFAKTENYTDASNPICKIPLTIDKKAENPPYVSGMSSSYTINKGEKLRLNGTVYGYSQLTTVTVSVTDWSREADRQSSSPYSESYSLSNFTLDTSSLAAGTYTVRVWAHTANCQPSEDIAEAILYVNEIHEDAPYISGASSSYTVSEDGRIILSGTVYGESRLTVVTAMIRNDYNIDTKISYTPNSSSYSLSNFTFNLSDYDLPAGGSYSVWIFAKTENYTDTTYPIIKIPLTITSGDRSIAESDAQNISITFASGDSDSNVTKDIILPTKGVKGSTITWSSSDTRVISNSGKVTSSAVCDSYAIMSASVKYGNSTVETSFFLVVPKKTEKTPWYEPGSYTYTAAADAKLTFSGTVKSESNMTKVTLGIVDKVTGIERQISANPYSTSFNLSNLTYDFSDYNLKPGTYIVELWVKTEGITDPKSSIATFVVTITESKANLVKTDKEALRVAYGSGDSYSSVTSNLTLPTKGNNGSSISWTTSDSSVITTSGKVTRPISKDVSVTLTATLKLGSCTETKSFTVTVLKRTEKAPYCENMASSYTVAEDGKLTLAGKVIGASKLTHVTVNVKNAKGINTDCPYSPNTKTFNLSNVTMDFSSFGLEPGNYTLRVWAKTEITTEAKSPIYEIPITITASEENLATADKNAVKIGYADGDSSSSVTKNLTLPKKGSVNNSTITWSSDNTDVISKSGTVTRQSKNVTVKLTAKITNGSVSVTKSFKVTVLAKESEEKLTVEASEKNGVLTLSVKHNLSDSKLGKVTKTWINVYDKNNSNKLVLSEEKKGAITSYKPDLSSGDYGFEVVYYDSSKKVIAKGEVRKTFNISIEGDSLVSSLTQGSTATLKGTVKSVAGIKTISVEIKNDAGETVHSKVSVDAGGATSYKLSTKALDNQILFDTLPKGEMVLTLTVTDKSGNELTKKYNFTVTAEKKPTISGCKDSYEITEGENVTLCGTISSKTNLTVVTAQIDKYDKQTKASKKYTSVKTKVDLSDFTVKTAELEPGEYTIKIYAKTVNSGDTAYTLKKISLTIVDEEIPVMSDSPSSYKIEEDNNLSIEGIVSSTSPLTEITVKVKGYSNVSWKYLPVGPLTSYPLVLQVLNTSLLEPGKYSIQIIAKTEAGKEKEYTVATIPLTVTQWALDATALENGEFPTEKDYQKMYLELKKK